MKTKFPRQPTCEICKKEEADRFVNFPAETSEGTKRGWVFAGACMADEGHYEILMDRFFHSAPATTDWIAHMHEKTWMDWRDFAEMFRRFRAATESYGMP